jgi:branched-chain amino acid transport system substrate-binding protein
MKHRRALFAIIAVVVIAVVGWLIYRANVSPREEVIKIGAILPLTGELAEFGTDERRGMDLALREINKTGGINGKQLRIIFEDSRSDPKEAVSALQKMLTVDRPPVVFSLGSSISLALVPIVEQHGVVLVAVAATPKLSGISPWVFRNFPSATLQARKLARLAREQLGIERVAILYINDDLGIGSRDAFVEFFTNAGGTVVFQDAYNKDGRDFRYLVSKVMKLKIDAVYVPGYGDALGLVVKQLREGGFKNTILSSQEFGYPRVLEVAGDAGEGVIYADIPYAPDSNDSRVKRFVKKFREAYSRDPTLDAVLAYDEVNFVAETIRRVGTSPEAIRDALRQLSNYAGVSGNLSVLPSGEIDFSVVLKVIRDGRPRRLS